MNNENTQKGLKSRAATKKLLVRFVTWINVVVYRLSGGRLINKAEGGDICLVTMTGHKSGKQKTIALMYTADGDNVLLVASLGGAPQHPVWYYNLKAQPEIEIQLGAQKRKMLAREASSAERQTLWPKVVASYGSFDAYQKLTTREIPVFVCSPRN